MRSLLKTAAGIALAIVVFLFFAVRIILDMIGYTTSPDDFALLQARWPKVLEWLFSTPWWVPSLFMAALTGLAAWLLWSGLRGVAVTPAADAPQPITRQEMDAAIAERISALPPSHASPDRDDAAEGRFEAVEAAAKAARDDAEGANTAQSHLHAELREDLQSVRNGIANHIDGQRDFQQKMELWVGRIREGVERQIGNIDQGFLAILDRENLLRLATDITDRGDALSGPTRDEPIEDWSAWFKAYQVWKRDVQNWTRIAGEYRGGVADRINDTPDEEYRGEWKAKDAYFPDATAVRDYRTFRIVLRNFHVEKSHVESCVQMRAFIRPSMKGNVYPSPRDAKQMPVSPPGDEGEAE